MNYNITLLFSPIFWISAGTVLFLLVALTFKWRIKMGNFSQETGMFKWRARIASLPYWLLAFSIFGIAFIAYMGQGDSRDFEFSFLLLAAVVSLVLMVIAFGVWKRNFWGYLAALVLNFSSILGSLMFFLYIVQFPCEGLGCLGISIFFLVFVGSFGVGTLATFLVFRLLKKQANSRAAFHTLFVALFLSVVLIGIATAGFIQEDVVNQETAKEKFEQFPEGILYPTYLPETLTGPTYERKDIHVGGFSYVYFIGYSCGESNPFTIWETPSEGVRDRNYESGKVDSFPGPGSFYAYYTGHRYVLERDGLVITFHNYDCGFNQQEIMKIAESMEEK